MGGIFDVRPTVFCHHTLGALARRPLRLSRSKGLPGNAVAYVRVSTTGQAKSGLGLAAQVSAIKAFAESEGYKIASTFEEHESGKGANALDLRPKLAAAIKAAKELSRSRLRRPTTSSARRGEPSCMSTIAPCSAIFAMRSVIIIGIDSSVIEVS
jgi:hypothetical protein